MNNNSIYTFVFITVLGDEVFYSGLVSAVDLRIQLVSLGLLSPLLGEHHLNIISFASIWFIFDDSL